MKNKKESATRDLGGREKGLRIYLGEREERRCLQKRDYTQKGATTPSPKEIKKKKKVFGMDRKKGGGKRKYPANQKRCENKGERKKGKSKFLFILRRNQGKGEGRKEKP